MISRLRALLFPVLVQAALPTVHADIRLPAIFGSNMVLQQNTNFLLWGWAAPNDRVVVRCSWLPGREFTAQADKENLRWSVELPVPEAGFNAQSITIGGGWKDIVLENILFGEVWLCSGQSNMEWKPNWGNVDVPEAYYRATEDAALRFFTVGRMSMPRPQDDCKGEWSVSSRQTMQEFSATAYFFGRELRDRLQVPVGLITAAWGGTPIEAWMHAEHFLTDSYKKIINQKHPVWNFGRPGSLRNGMLAPLTSLNIKGVIWYQGESNTFNPNDYALLLRRFAADLREDFRQPQLPFYYVQIAPFQYKTPNEGALVRDQQRRALAELPHAGMVVISDIGDIHDIHPRNKIDVGKRLAAWALANTYNQTGIPYSGPLFKGLSKENNRLRLYFHFADNGLVAKNGPLTGFEIAGADGRFLPANAEVDGSSVLVWADNLPDPADARFAFDNLATPNLFNTEGLPASCFRTDNHPVLWRSAEFYIDSFPALNRALLRITCSDPDARLRYTLDKHQLPENEGIWLDTFQTVTIERGQTISVRVYNAQGLPSPRLDTFELVSHLASGLPVESIPPPNPRYAGLNGAYSLTDGLTGRPDPDQQAWLGYSGTSPVWTLDLGSEKNINNIRVQFLVAVYQWVFPPRWVWLEYSSDGLEFKRWKRLEFSQPERYEEPYMEICQINDIGKKARYLRLRIESIGLCPNWHHAAGKPAWLFADEWMVEGR